MGISLSNLGRPSNKRLSVFFHCLTDICASRLNNEPSRQFCLPRQVKFGVRFLPHRPIDVGNLFPLGFGEGQLGGLNSFNGQNN
jgi:hypothetical protein